MVSVQYLPPIQVLIISDAFLFVLPAASRSCPCVPCPSQDIPLNRNCHETSTNLLVISQEVLHRIGSISSVGVAATIHGLDHNRSHWPFVTLPSFLQRTASARVLSGAHLIRLSPLVTEADRGAWEVYSAASDDVWV